MSDNSFVTMNVASSGMKAQSLRMRLAAENIANADSPAYKRRTVSFAALHDSQNPAIDYVGIDKIGRDNSDFKMTYDPSNPMADKNGYVKGSNVNSLIEMTNAKEANRAYDASMSMFEQARDMYNKMLDLLKS